MAAFCEANILWSPNKKMLYSKVEKAIKLGFDHIVTNYEIPDLGKKKTKKKDEQESTFVKAAEEIKISDEFLREVAGPNRKIRQYTRCTCVISDAAQTNKIQNSKEIQEYDIIAVTPVCNKTFTLVCGTLEIDIISLDLTRKLDFTLKRSQVNLAISRGIHFEICYSPAIRDNYLRRFIISNAMSLIAVSKGKNIIISSGCEKVIEVRSPFDAANLGFLFGMSQQQTKMAVSLNCRSMLLHAKSRKTCNTVLSLERVEDIETEKKTETEEGDATELSNKRKTVAASSPAKKKRKV